MSTYETPTVTDLGSLDALTQAKSHKHGGTGDVMSSVGTSLSTPIVVTGFTPVAPTS